MTIATDSWTFDLRSGIEGRGLFVAGGPTNGFKTKITGGRQRNLLREMVDYLWIRAFYVLAEIDFSM